MTGGGAAAVSALISSTLELKNEVKSSAEWSVVPVTFTQHRIKGSPQVRW